MTPPLLDLSSSIIKLKEWADREPLVLALFIYGSYARGSPTPDSDLDIALANKTEDNDEDPFTTFMCNQERWTADLRALLDFPKIHLEWFGAPEIKAALKQNRIVVYSSLRE